MQRCLQLFCWDRRGCGAFARCAPALLLAPYVVLQALAEWLPHCLRALNALINRHDGIVYDHPAPRGPKERRNQHDRRMSARLRERRGSERAHHAHWRRQG